MLFNVRLALVVQNYELLSTSLGPYEKTVQYRIYSIVSQAITDKEHHYDYTIGYRRDDAFCAYWITVNGRTGKLIR